MPDEPAPTGDLRVVVVGAGAVGSFLGGTLAAAGADVTLLGRRQAAGPTGRTAAATDALVRDALVLDEPAGERHVSVGRTTDPRAIRTPDLAILAVKTFDLGAALETTAAWPGTAILTAQNGVGAEAIADAWTPFPTPLLAASLTTAVELVDGRVVRRRTGGIGVAVARDDESGSGSALVDRLVAAWTAGGLPARRYPDADAMKWSKLLANLVGNASSAILDLAPGEIYADPRTYGVERRQLREALAVMRATGHRPVAIPGADVSMLLRGIALPAAIGRPLVARGIAGARGGKSPSLRLHVREGGEGPTESRWLNGAVVAAGALAGVPTPVNAALAGLVEEVAADPERAAFFAGRPDRLADAVDAWEPGP